MYRKNAEGWLKHVDFLVLDFLGLQLAFLLSWYLRIGNFSFLHKQANGIVWIVLVLFSICVSFLTENHRDIIRRGYLVEFKAVLKQTMYVIVCESMFLFLWKGAENFSRLVFLYFAVLYFCFCMCFGRSGSIYLESTKIFLSQPEIFCWLLLLMWLSLWQKMCRSRYMVRFILLVLDFWIIHSKKAVSNLIRFWLSAMRS